MKKIHAYNEFYLYEAQCKLGIVVDFLMNCCVLSNEQIEQIFKKSKLLSYFCYGHPSIIAGYSGIELGLEIANEFKLDIKQEYSYTFEKTVYYWIGYVLAFYSWYECKPFSYIFYGAKFEKLIEMYPCYHEMDIMHFVEDFNQYVFKGIKESNLKLLRLINNLSQSELADKSGVSLRSIQLYEQGVNDINKAQAGSLYKLAKTLNSNIEDLLEIH